MTAVLLRAEFMHGSNLDIPNPRIEDACHTHDMAVEAYNAGRLDEAEQLLHYALQQFEQTEGTDHPDVAAALGDLGMLYEARSDFAAAETCYERVATMVATIDDDGDDAMALLQLQALSNRGRILRRQGCYAQAEAIIRRALAFAEHRFGARLSGGEGQRVRFGRALLRPETRLVILDEPFRGLDRERRRDLLHRARHLWADATLLCITHDVGETQGFERVLVMDQGRVVEDGAPGTLRARPESRYRELLEAEAAVRATMWSGPRWRHLELRDGQVHDCRIEGGS